MNHTKYRCHNHFLYFFPSFDQTTNITDLYKLFYLAGIKKVKATKKKKFDLQNTEHEGKPISTRKVKKQYHMEINDIISYIIVRWNVSEQDCCGSLYVKVSVSTEADEHVNAF